MKRPAVGDFRVQKEFGGSYAAAEASPALIEFGGRVLRRLPLTPAFARVDVLEGDGPLLMELEIIEPELFLTGPETVARAANAIRNAVSQNGFRAVSEKL